MSTSTTDDDPVAITLTRAQWRRVRAAIPEVWSGDQLVLWDALTALDPRPGLLHDPAEVAALRARLEQ